MTIDSHSREKPDVKQHSGSRLRRTTLVGVGILAVTTIALVDVTYAAATRSSTDGPAVPGPSTFPRAASPDVKSSGLPKAPKGAQTQGLVVNRTNTSDRAAKVKVKYPPTTALAQIVVSINKPPPPNPLSHGRIFAHVFVTSPKHAKRPFGILPTEKVTALGFGSIPVTAKLHAQQLVRHGKTVPLILHYRGTFAANPAGNFFVKHPHLRGPLGVRISDVKVDGTPLHVGPSCRAVPAKISLTAGKGSYSQPPFPKKLYIPFSDGGTLAGTLNIPAFHGCADGREDLDPLLTGFVAGPGNHLLIHQKGPLQSYPPGS